MFVLQTFRKPRELLLKATFKSSKFHVVPVKQFVAGGSHLSPDGIELLVYHSGRWVFLSFLVSGQEISVEEMHGGGWLCFQRDIRVIESSVYIL